VAVDTSLLARRLVGTHLLLAGVSGSPELAMNAGEASELAGAISDLLAQYGWAIDPKIQAWANLVGTAAAIYVPRAIGIAARKTKAAGNGRAVPDDVLKAAAAAGGIH